MHRFNFEGCAIAVLWMAWIATSQSSSSLQQAVEFCILPATVHIPYNATCDQFSNISRSNINWAMSQGEYENVQLLIYFPPATTAPSPVNMTYQFSNLSSADGTHSFSPQLSVYQVGHVFCNATTRYGGSGGGWRPDPLFEISSTSVYSSNIPLSTPYLVTKESLKTTTNVKNANNNNINNDKILKHSNAGYADPAPPSNLELFSTTVWMTLFIPYDTPSMTFYGSIDFKFNNGSSDTIGHVPINVTVWDIKMPNTKESDFQTAFSFDESTLSSFYNSTKYNLTEMKYKYFDLLTKSRIPPDELYMSSPRVLSDYYYLSKVTSYANLEDVESHIGSQCSNFSDSQINSVFESLNDTIVGLTDADILNISYVYGFDEADQSECESGVYQLFGSILKEYNNTIRTMAALNWGNMPQDLPLNVWTLQYEYYNETKANAWVTTTKNQNQNENENKNKNKDKQVKETIDHSLWLYHCIEPSGIDYLNTFIERPLLETRLMFWLGASYNIQGWLYYAVNLWNGCPGKGIPNKHIIHRYFDSTHNIVTPFTDFNPANYIWCPRTDIFANGDGYFMYPGVDGPVTTSRLTNIRDGLEDILLLRMNDQNKQFINQIVTGPTQYILNPILLEKIRREAVTSSFV